MATTYALETPTAPLQDPALVAAAGFLAGYSGTTRAGYTIDLRGWWRFCELHGLDVWDARRAHLELYIRSLEDHGYARSTIDRRISTVATYYRWCVEEELLDRNPAAHVRRPKIDQESTTLGLDRSELGAFLVEAGLYSARDHALACLLGLNGLRVSEACNSNIESLAMQRGHRTLAIIRKGGKHATIPLAPRTARAIDLAVNERSAGPILLGNNGERLDRCAAYRHAFITAALDAGVPLRDVQEAASHADPCITVRYDRARVSLDRHAAYTVAAFVAGATSAR